MSTIKDVAKRANVSVCTVSRALANKEYIKPETKERILEAVKELDYHPNNAAVSLKTGSSNTIALIVPDILNYYYTELAKYVEKYANKAGYMVFLCNSDNSLEKEKDIITRIKSLKVNGIVIVPCTNEHEHVLKLQEVGIPYVYLNRTFIDDIDHCIRVDNFSAAYDIVSFLIEKGYTRIGAVFQNFSNMIYEERYEGMLKAMEEHKITLNKENILFNAEDLDHVYIPIKKMLERKDRPEVIFASNDMLAFEVYKAANMCGLRIPDDIAVVGYDDTLMAGKMIPTLTSYKMPAKKLSELAVERILNQESFKRIRPLKGKLMVRDSVKVKSNF